VADYAAIRAALGTALSASSTFIQVASTVPDTVSPPAALVTPGSPVAEYHGAFGNGMERFVFTVTCVAQRFDDTAQQTLLDGLISGAAGVRALIEADKTLGGESQTLQVTNCTSYGVVSISDVEYLGTDFTVEVFA